MLLTFYQHAAYFLKDLRPKLEQIKSKGGFKLVLLMLELRTFLPLTIRGEGLLGSCSFFLLDSCLFLSRELNGGRLKGQQQAPWIPWPQVVCLSTHSKTNNSMIFFFYQSFRCSRLSTRTWLCSKTTCKEAYLSISALQKQPHVYKDKTSVLRSNNAALPPIQRSLSLTTWHPPGLADPPLCSKIIC